MAERAGCWIWQTGRRNYGNYPWWRNFQKENACCKGLLRSRDHAYSAWWSDQPCNPGCWIYISSRTDQRWKRSGCRSCSSEHGNRWLLCCKSKNSSYCNRWCRKNALSGIPDIQPLRCYCRWSGTGIPCRCFPVISGFYPVSSDRSYLPGTEPWCTGNWKSSFRWCTAG